MGPKQNCYISHFRTGLYAASFISCGQAYRFHIRKQRVRLVLVQILQTCVYHLKPLVILTPRYLILSTLSRTVPSRLYEAWIFYPFPRYLHHITIDRLKSHTPFHWPASQLIYIFLKFQSVLCILNFSVKITVIRKESYVKINVFYKGPRTVTCGTADKTEAQSNFSPLLSVAQKRMYLHLCHSQTICS